MNAFVTDVKNVTDLYSEIFCNQILHEFRFLDVQGNPIFNIANFSDIASVEFRFDADSCAYRIMCENLDFQNCDFTEDVFLISINPISTKCEVSCFLNTELAGTDFVVVKKILLLLSLKPKPKYSTLLVTHQKCVGVLCGQHKSCVKYKGRDNDDKL